MRGGYVLRNRTDWVEALLIFGIAIILIIMASGCGSGRQDPRFCDMIKNELTRLSYGCRDLNECLGNNQRYIESLQDLQEKNGCR